MIGITDPRWLLPAPTPRLLLPAPAPVLLLPATCATTKPLPLPDLDVLLPLQMSLEPAFPATEAYNKATFLESAYLRCVQAGGDEDLQFFRVARHKSEHDPRPDRTHPDKRLADRLVGEGLLERHPNRRMCRYRITALGITMAIACSPYWNDDLRPYRKEQRDKFERLAAELVRQDLYILPEPGRSWRVEMAFEELEKGWRHLYSYKPAGYRRGFEWKANDNGYTYTDAPAFAYELQLAGAGAEVYEIDF